MILGGFPLSAAVVVPRNGLRRWHVEALQRSTAAGHIRLDAVIETPREPRVADYLVSALAAGERLLPRARACNGGPARLPLRGHCSPDAAWPGIQRIRWNTNGRLGSEHCWGLVINLAGQSHAAALKSSAEHGVIELRIGASGHLDDVLMAIRLRHPTIELCATLAFLEGRTDLANSIAAVKENLSVNASVEVVLARAGVVLSRAISRVCTPSSPCAKSAATLTANPGLSTRQAAAVAHATVRDYMHAAVSRLRSISPRWFLAYRESPEHFVSQTDQFSPHGFTPIMPPRGHFYADPCVFARGETDHVFFEDFDYATGRGVISWMQRLGPGQFSQPEEVLSRPYHLSYPFVFDYRGEIFMVPETYYSRRVELYRATDFPRRWEHAAVLVDDIEAVDATLLEHEGRWWMFVNVGEAASSTGDELYLFYADSPFGPWRPHCRNPVKSDARSARPAGRLFMRNGRLIRPAQNCSVRYGGSLVLCEVQELSTSCYRERVVEEIGPGWLPGNSGFHTLSFSPRLEVVDGSRPVFTRGRA